MVILRVLLEMVGQAVDALGQQRDLHLGRAGVALVGAELLDQTLLLVDSKRHAPPLQSPRPGEPSLPRQGGFQNSLFCPQIRWECTTRAWRSKAHGRVTGSDALRPRRARSAPAARRRSGPSAPPGPGEGPSGPRARGTDNQRNQEDEPQLPI